MSYKFVTKQSYVPGKGDETPKGKSMTVPAMALSIPEIEKRYAAGSLGNIAKEAYFSNPENFEAMVSHMRPDLDLSDLSDARKIFTELWEQEKSSSNGKDESSGGGEADKKGAEAAGSSEAIA